MTEKGSEILVHQDQEGLSRVKRSKRHFLAIVSGFLLLSSWLQFSQWTRDDNFFRSDQVKVDKEFQWEDITPSPSLEYHDCFGKFQCARLEVPLDWKSTAKDGGPKAAIAIVKTPAKVEVTDPRYGGVVLLNPGGPGGSGVSFILQIGAAIQTVVDSPVPVNESIGLTTEKYFDILSWDPRAVNNTTPNSVTIEDTAVQQSWAAQLDAIGTSILDPIIFSQLWSRVRAYGARVALTQGSKDLGDVGPIAQYLSTAFVVRDMVEIIERHGEFREKRARQLLSKTAACGNRATILGRTAWHKGEEPLQLWGFSYGTFLGQTFASMYPNRVHRVVLDGVVDADLYMAQDWASDVIDLDKVTTSFAFACYAAGPTKCALYDPAGGPQILANFYSILADLKTSPITIMSPTTGAMTTVSHSAALAYIFQNWYHPLNGFPDVASFLADVRNGNITAYASQNKPITCDLPSRPSPYDHTFATVAIICSEGDSLLEETPDSFTSSIANYISVTPLFGEYWRSTLIGCTNFRTRAKVRFRGPFGGKTAHPILFASQRLDPVCPLMNAESSAKKFPGAVVVQANGAGHCSVAMPSLCLFKTVRDYFQTGNVPEGGRKCDVDVKPFDGVLKDLREMKVEDLSLLEAGKGIGEGVTKMAHRKGL